MDEEKIKSALTKSYTLLSPYSSKSRWEFNHNFKHIQNITKHLGPGCSIYDAGCGIGILALALKLLGYKAEGGDKYVFLKNTSFSQIDLSGLQKIWNDNNLKIENLDMLKNEPAKKYDAVISIATIEHQSNPKLFLRNLKQLVRENGWVYIATPNLANLANRLRFLLGRPPLNNIREFYKNGEFVGHFREYTLSELVWMLEEENIKILEAKTQEQTKFSFAEPRKSFFSLLSGLFPNTGNAICITGKKN